MAQKRIFCTCSNSAVAQLRLSYVLLLWYFVSILHSACIPGLLPLEAEEVWNRLPLNSLCRLTHFNEMLLTAPHSLRSSGCQLSRLACSPVAVSVVHVPSQFRPVGSLSYQNTEIFPDIMQERDLVQTEET